MKLIKGSSLVSSVFLINAGLQLITQIVITRIFGTSFGLESYLAAVAIPTVLISAIYATLNDAFLPQYGELLVTDKKKAKKHLESIISSLLILSIITSLLFYVLAKPLMSWLYSSQSIAFIKQTVQYFRWLILSLPLATTAVIGGSVYYANKNYFRFPIGQLGGNLIILITTLSLAKFLGSLVLVLGFISSLIWQVWWLKPKKIKLKIAMNKQLDLLKAWLPLIVGFLIFRSEGIIIRYFAGKMPPGYFVYLNLASKFFLMATGVATIGIQILLLPNLVEKINQTKYQEAIFLIKKAKLLALGISVLVVGLVWLITPWLLKILFLGGKFSMSDIQKVQEALHWFIIPAIGWGVYPIFLQPLIALKKQKLVAMTALIAGVLASLIGWLSKNLNSPMISMNWWLSSLMISTLVISELIWQREKSKLR